MTEDKGIWTTGPFGVEFAYDNGDHAILSASKTVSSTDPVCLVYEAVMPDADAAAIGKKYGVPSVIVDHVIDLAKVRGRNCFWVEEIESAIRIAQAMDARKAAV